MIRNIIYQVLQGLAFIHKHGKFKSPSVTLLLIETFKTDGIAKYLYVYSCTFSVLSIGR